MTPLRAVFIFALCFCYYPAVINSLYSNDDELKSLLAAEFQQKVIAKQEVWLIKFFSPGCGHCVSMAPQFKKAAKILKGIVNVGVVDINVNPQLGNEHAPDGVPEILLFNLDQQKRAFTKVRTADSIVQFVLDAFNEVIVKRGGPAAKQRQETSSETKDEKVGGGKDSDYLLDGSVINLTDDNFNSEMAKKKDVLWLVEFFAPWCGHCKNLEPNWKKAAKRLKGVAILAAVDATVHSQVTGRFNINGFPTIKVFYPGSHDNAKEYNGPRDADGIVEWVRQQAQESAPAPEVNELLSQEQFSDATQNSITVISFLPHLLDCQSKCRNDFIEMLKSLAKRFQRNEWKWLWTEEMVHPELEESVGVGGFGYPTMAVVNKKKNVYAILKGVFDKNGIDSFLKQIVSGRGASVPLKGEFSSIKTVNPWNGKDFIEESEKEPDEEQKVTTDKEL